MRVRLLLPLFAAFLLCAVPLLAVEPGALQIVAGDSVAVGMVRVDMLRTSPMMSRIFNETDHASMDGDGQRFLREAGLDVKKDVDVVVFSMRPVEGSGAPLVAVEGRFDTDRLSKALVTRGGKSVQTERGNYFVTPDKENGEQFAVAFLNRRLIVLGSERSVVTALNAFSRGGSGFAGSTLGSEMDRFKEGASAWMLFDVKRMNAIRPADKIDNRKNGDAVMAAMKSVDVAGFWSAEANDSLRVGGFALSTDAETRQLVEDAARGLLAAWRLTAQDKMPEIVPVLREFKVDQTRDGVTLEGSLPRTLIEKMQQKNVIRDAKTSDR